MRYAIMITLVLFACAHAWWGQTHALLARSAVKAVPRQLPEFFRASATQIAHAAVDPDVSKHPRAPAARESEYPEHYCDLDMMQSKPLPRARFDFIRLTGEIGVRPEKVGMLPYALAEWTDRLAVAFAEHRAWPANQTVRAKCAFYAGFIAHYAADLCQPLHVTIHYDGRARPDGSSPRSGIHEKVDGLLDRMALTPAEICSSLTVVTTDSVFAFVLAQMDSSRARIDTLYALDPLLPTAKGTAVDPRVRAFALDQARRAAAVTAALYSAAWRASATIPMEEWLDRDKLDSDGARGAR